MTMTAKKKKILFWSVLMLAIILRCIRFGSVPDGINQDEAMGAMDAWALSKYGTDRYGTFLPVHFEAWKYGQMSASASVLHGAVYQGVWFLHRDGEAADAAGILWGGCTGIFSVGKAV